MRFADRGWVSGSERPNFRTFSCLGTFPHLLHRARGIRQRVDAKLIKHHATQAPLSEAFSSEDVSRGFARGPFFEQDAVTEQLGTNAWECGKLFWTHRRRTCCSQRGSRHQHLETTAPEGTGQSRRMGRRRVRSVPPNPSSS